MNFHGGNKKEQRDDQSERDKTVLLDRFGRYGRHCDKLRINLTHLVVSLWGNGDVFNNNILYCFA